MPLTESEARALLEQHRQQHVLQFIPSLNASERAALLGQIEVIDFALMDRLIRRWVLSEPAPEVFSDIRPVDTIPVADMAHSDAREAWDAGEEALRQGRVGLILVAGGQGTRLGFDGPKGAYPIGPISGAPLFQFHAEKIRNAQSRYGCELPWYIMVSQANRAATRVFFEQHAFFGLDPENVLFFEQRMVPCVDESGKFMLEEPCCLATNPNGHGGVIPAMVENGLAVDAARRGVDTFSYFQVDNWAVKVADPVFIGYHVLRQAEMSSKVHRKNDPREAVGVHCLCDGEYRTIEYSELDIYPQLLDTDAQGNLLYYAGNPAIHILSRGFIERVCAHYDEFPWHRAYKKIPFVNGKGELVKPDKPNGYKFETFVFDALRFISHPPVALEIERRGEYTPIKSFEGTNSVQAAWHSMRQHWGGWLDAAGCPLDRDERGDVATPVEISPAFALYKDEFQAKVRGWTWPKREAIAIDAGGRFLDGRPVNARPA